MDSTGDKILEHKDGGPEEVGLPEVALRPQELGPQHELSTSSLCSFSAPCWHKAGQHVRWSQVQWGKAWVIHSSEGGLHSGSRSNCQRDTRVQVCHLSQGLCPPQPAGPHHSRVWRMKTEWAIHGSWHCFPEHLTLELIVQCFGKSSLSNSPYT